MLDHKNFPFTTITSIDLPSPPFWCNFETIYHRLGIAPMCWYSNPAKTLFETWTHMAGTLTQPKPCLELEPMWLGLKPSWNPAWDLNPFGWVSYSAKTHGTWFQDLRKLKFLLSHHRKNSVRDKVIGKKWIYSDSERSTLHRVWAIAEGECRHEMWPG